MSWGFVAFAVAAASAAGGTYAQHEQIKAEEDIADYNEAVSRQRADATAKAMETETSMANASARRLKAEQRAILSKTGALPTTGTPLLVMMEQAGNIEMDILMQRYNRQKEIAGYGSQADMTAFEGAQASRAAKISTGSTLLSSASSLSSSSFKGTGGTKSKTASGSYGGGFTVPDYSKSKYTSKR